MFKFKLLEIIIVLTFAIFCVTEFLGNELLSKYIWASFVPLFALHYFLNVKKKTRLFCLFIVIYAISDLLVLIENQFSYFVFYFIGNSLYLLAYGFLLLEISKSLSLLHVIKNFKIHLIVLMGLNIYIVYILQAIINQNIVGSTEFIHGYLLEIGYNVMMLLVLSVALINYFYRDNKKALFLFIGSLCIVFSEVINVAYLYISPTNLLNFISSSLAILAFYFYYQQSKLKNEKANGNVT